MLTTLSYFGVKHTPSQPGGSRRYFAYDNRIAALREMGGKVDIILPCTFECFSKGAI
jgi:hypothetical protein